MNRKKFLIVIRRAAFVLLGMLTLLNASKRCSQAQLMSVFDHAIGQETYFGDLASGNWVTSFAGLSPHSGSNFFASANGNASTDFPDIGFSKVLGGTIGPQSYSISFFIAKYQDQPTLPLSGIPFSDFSQLRIGGAGGITLWTNTPTPVQNAVWVQWCGIYTPFPTDVGKPFTFSAMWNERARSSIAIDGLMIAAVVPEPSTLAAGGLVCLFFVSYRTRIGWAAVS